MGIQITLILWHNLKGREEGRGEIKRGERRSEGLTQGKNKKMKKGRNRGSAWEKSAQARGGKIEKQNKEPGDASQEPGTKKRTILNPFTLEKVREAPTSTPKTQKFLLTTSKGHAYP